MEFSYALLVVVIAVIAFLVVGNFIATTIIRKRESTGKSLSEVKEEFEIRKSVFAIIGGVSILFGGAFSFYEFGLKIRVEERQALYSALGQLVAVDDKRPEISAAALLQLERLGATSDLERPALIQIVTAYLNERAKKPVSHHEKATTARPDIQMAIYVLSKLLNGDRSLGQLALLKEVDLRHVRVDRVQLLNVKLLGVDFRHASMRNANFAESVLTGSQFDEAVMVNVDVTDTTLDHANFTGADVSDVDFCVTKSRTDTNLSNLGKYGGARCVTP